MSKKENRGGARKGAGRPKAEVKKRQFNLWVAEGHINALGDAAAKTVGEGAIERAAKKILK